MGFLKDMCYDQRISTLAFVQGWRNFCRHSLSWLGQVTESNTNATHLFL
jgi:hypothetical protein